MAVLAREILLGVRPAGSFLPNAHLLATQFGVSRSALREALKVLGAKGLLEGRPKVGTRVCGQDRWNLLDPEVLSWFGPDIPAELLRDTIAYRRMVEPGAAALAATGATVAQLAIVGEALDRMVSALDIEARIRADLDFHAAVMAASGNRLLASWAAAMSVLLLEGFRRSAGAVPTPDETFAIHREVLEALRLREPQTASRAYHKLLDIAQKDLLSAAQWPRKRTSAKGAVAGKLHKSRDPA